jgi:ATP-dependent Clp endopeptidase proteolytic subunit ClpP
MSDRKDNLDYLLEYGIDLERRIVYMHGDIEFGASEIIRKILKYWESKSIEDPITIDINSMGGDLYDAMSIVDSIKTCRCPIITIVSGASMSGASLISVCGDRRLATENSSFMLHELSSWESDRHSIVKSSIKYNDELMERMYRIYEENSKIQKRELKEKMLKDWFLTAQEAFDRGLIDEILPSIGILSKQIKNTKDGE